MKGLKQVAIILVPLLLFGFMLIGGMGSYPNLGEFDNNPDPSKRVNVSDSGGADVNYSLQLRSMQPGDCVDGGTVAVNLLLDNSSSMSQRNGNRIKELREAVIAFASNFNDQDVIGAQRFNTRPGNLVDLNTWAANKASFNTAIMGLKPDGGTHMKGGLKYAMEKITPVLPQYPDHRWVLILVSDGRPNPYPQEDPRELAKEAKKQIRIITVGIDLDTLSEDGELAKTVLRETASSPEDFYNTSTDTVEAVFRSIATSLGCVKTPKPTAVACTTGKPAVNILLDTSNSIEGEINELRSSVLTLVRQFSDTDIVGIQDFSGPPTRSPGRNLVPIGVYSTNKSRIESTISNLNADENQDAYTYMKDGFSFAKTTIDGYSTIPDYKKWALIFFSDGHPKTAAADPDPTQDPTPIATELKNGGMRIITVSLGTDADRALMRRLASKEEDAKHAANASELATIFGGINQTLCQ